MSTDRKNSIVNFSKIVDSSQIEKRINKDFDSLSDYLDIVRESTLFLSDRSKSTLTNSIVQPTILSKFDNEIIEKIIKPILIKESIKSEHAYAYAGEVLLRLAVDMSSILLKRKRSDSNSEKYISTQVDSMLLAIRECEERFDKSCFQDILRKISNQKIRKIIKETINLSGALGTINVSRSAGSRTLISQNTGFKFNITSDSTILSGKSWIRKNVRCFVIDGILETVSEIHHLLEQASQNKEPYVLFVRNISPEVEKTIRINLIRKTIDVLPICVGFDENTINILNDISIVANSKIVSSLYGDLISASIRKDPIIISEIQVFEDSFIINNSNFDQVALNNHLGFLTNKMNLSNNPEKKSLILNRIRSLSCHGVEVEIGKDIINSDTLAIEKIDKHLRLIKSCCSGKIIKKSKLKKKLDEMSKSNILDKDICDSVKKSIKSQPDILSSQGLGSCLVKSQSIARSIVSAGAIVIEDS